MKAMNESILLLRTWINQGSEDAFAKLVAQHIDLVYSVALRKVAGDTGLAADITQTVFADLARKARTLSDEGSLSGWLHRHTCFVAATALRGELRRRAREQTAVAMHALDTSSDPEWSRLAPLLDDAVNALDNIDRRAILLRFYEQRDLRTVGSVLGVSDDTAQKRVSRALEKLRSWLARRGVTSTTVALATMLGVHSVSAAPTGMAAAVASTAIASAAAGTGVTLTFLELMASMKAKLAAAIAVGAIVATPLVWQETAIAKIRAENRALAANVDSTDQQLAPVVQTNPSLVTSETNNDRADLERLRNEVAALLSQLQQTREARQAATVRAGSERAAVALPPGMLTFESVRDVGTATSEQLIQTFFWAMFTANTNRIWEIGDWSAQGADKEFGKLVRDAAKASVEIGNDPRRYQIGFHPTREVPLDNGDVALVIEAFDNGNIDRTAFRVRRVGNEWRMVMGDGGPQEVKLSDDQMR